MGFTYRFSVEVGACCVLGLQSSLEKIFPKSEYTVRVSSARKRIEFETLNNEKYHYPTYLRFIKAIQEKGHDCEEPWVPHWAQGIGGILLGTVALVLCIFAPMLPFAAMLALGIASLIATLVLGFQSFKQTWKAIQDKRSLTMDFLFTLSTIIALAVSIASLFVPWLPMMFEVGLLIFGFHHVGLAMKSSMLKKIEKEESFQGLAPQTVKVKRNGDWIDCTLSDIKVDEVIQVAPDQVIPLDGEGLSKDVRVTEKYITGQDGTRLLRQQETILAGVQLSNDSPPLALRVKRTVGHSYLAKMDEATQRAAKDQAPIVEKTARALMYFVPIVILIAILSGLFVGLFVGVGLGISCAVAVLLSACPCTLGLVVPLAVLIGVEKAKRHGLILASGEALERAKDINTVVFDLNGTLTEGRLSAKIEWTPEKGAHEHHVSVTSERSKAKAIFSAIESKVLSMKNSEKATGTGAASSAIAQVILTALDLPKDVNIDPDQLVFEQTFAGGLSAIYEGKKWMIGNATFMREHGIELPVQHDQLEVGSQELWLACDHSRLGKIMIQDALRLDAEETILQLMKLKKNVYLCTGADYVTAKRYADKLSIRAEHIYADCIPIPTSQTDETLSKRPSKFQHIEALQALGHRVAFVGDGLNDAPVTGKSNLGVAMLHADTDVRTKQNTQVHIAGSLLKPLAVLFPIANQTNKWIKVCLGLSLGYNLISILLSSGVLLAVGVVLNPVIGAVLMVVQMGLLLLGAYFIHRKQVKLPPIEKPALETSYQQMVSQGLDVQASNGLIPHIEKVLGRNNEMLMDGIKEQRDLEVNPLSRAAI